MTKTSWFNKKIFKYPQAGIYNGTLGFDDWEKKIVIPEGGSDKPDFWEGINECYFYIDDSDFQIAELFKSWHTQDHIKSNDEEVLYSPTSPSFASNFEPILKELKEYNFLNSYVTLHQDSLNLDFIFYNPNNPNNKRKGKEFYETLILTIQICRKKNEKHADITEVLFENIVKSIQNKLAEYLQKLENGTVKYELDKITTASYKNFTINLQKDTDIYTKPISTHNLLINQNGM